MQLKNISFLSSYFFYLLPILGAILIYIYLKFKGNKKIFFPSFFLLENVGVEKIKNKKMNFPLRFFLELFIILLFIFFLANPCENKNTQSYLFLIDNSFSTKLKSKNDINVLSSIKKEALHQLSFLSFNSKIKIKTTDGTVNTELLNKKEASKTISSIFNTYSVDNIQNEKFRVNQFNEIFIFSDKNLSSSEAKIKTFNLKDSENSCNLSLSSLNVFQSDITWTISSFCQIAQQAKIKIICDKQEIFKTASNVLPFSTHTETYNLRKENNDAISECEIYLSSPNDMLSEDNKAYFLLNGKKKQKIYLVSNEEKQNKIMKLPFEIKKISHSETNSLDKNDIIIFDKQKLSTFPAFSSIINVPSTDSSFFKDKIKGENIPISDFKRGHSLLTYINPLILNFNDPYSIKFDKNDLQNDILKIKNETILSIAENNNKKFIISGFNIIPYEKEDIAIKILFLNAVKFLTKENFNNSYINLSNTPYSDIFSLGFYEKNGEKQAFNFFSNEESNILNSDVIKIKTSQNAIKKEVKEDKKTTFLSNIKSNFIFLIIFLILTETIYFIFKEKNK